MVDGVVTNPDVSVDADASNIPNGTDACYDAYYGDEFAQGGSRIKEFPLSVECDNGEGVNK